MCPGGSTRLEWMCKGVSTSFTSPRREFFASGHLLSLLKRTKRASPKGIKCWKRVVHLTYTPFSPCCSRECGVLIKPTYGVFRTWRAFAFFFLYIYIYTSFQFHFTSLRAFMCSHLVCRLPHLFFSLHCPQPGTQFREARTPHILVKSRVTPAPNMASRMMWYSSAVLAGCLVSAVGS